MVNIKLYKSQVTRYTYIVENEKGVLVSIISIIKKKGGGDPGNMRWKQMIKP
jgi:hypothetical protein